MLIAEPSFGAKELEIILHRCMPLTSLCLFYTPITKKTCAPYELTSFCRQCSALADVQFWRQKRKSDVSEKIRNLLKEAVGFFSQSHHDPQGSRLKIFPGLAFGGLPTFFARANIQSICTTTRSKPVFSRNIS